MTHPPTLPAFHSLTGAQESAEPDGSSSTSTSTSTSTTPTPTAAFDRDAAAAMPPTAAPPAAPPPPPPSSFDGPVPLPPRPQSLARERSLHGSASPSSANSPFSSRDVSPNRVHHHHRSTANPPGTNTAARAELRSRKSSSDVVPSAAAIQRALSATSIPQQPSAASSSDAPAPRAASRPPKPTSGSNSGDTTPHWPASPRIKSPPPNESRSRSRRNSLRTMARRPEAVSAPAIVVQSSSPASGSRIAVRDDYAASDTDEPVVSIKGPSRGPSGTAPKLETVQESSLPATPGFDGVNTQSFPSPATTHTLSEEERNDVSSIKVTEDLSTRPIHVNHNTSTGSGSDSGPKTATKAKMQEHRSTSTHRLSNVSSKPSLSSLSTRARDPPLRNMTVETETVPSIAQATISNQDRSASGRADGSLRLKPSNETIRPKKERKPAKRKAPSINAGTGRSSQLSYHYKIPTRPGMGPRSNTTSSCGSPVSYRSYDDWQPTLALSPSIPEMRVNSHAPSFRYFYSNTNSNSRKASSKADVFEQKVASAVDEANSSDSEATFIYESNPLEQQPFRSRRQHSRTPSMTSIASLADPRLAIRDTHKNPGKKSSMKFTNPYNNSTLDADALERGEGTMRVNSVRAGTGSHHHYIGRHGQGRGALSHIVLDSDSSVAQSSRARGSSSRLPSQPNSPRFHNFSVANGHSNGSHKYGELSTYDIDAGIVADDERTPLIPSSRSPRIRTPRRRDSVTLHRHLERRHRHNGGWCRRFAGCLVLSILLLVVIFSSVGLIFATTKPLTDVSIRDVLNVVATQDEIMLDLVVSAVNPNIIGVTIADMDVSVFAKSKHVGSDKWLRLHGEGSLDNEEDWQHIDASEADEKLTIAKDGIDEGTDPIEDPDLGEPRTMSLGRISNFDLPLIFEGSFFKRHRAESIGEIRLLHPGSKTEIGGVKRWERVLQYPFEFIVQGTFKYQLPLSTREHAVLINASYHYDPDAEKKKMIKMVAATSMHASSSSAVPPTPTGRFHRRTPPSPPPPPPV